MYGGKMMRKLLCAVFVLTFALGLASPGWAQSQITAGSVEGNVLDEKGGSVAGATVEAKNLATNFVQTETSGTDGHFAFLSPCPPTLAKDSPTLAEICTDAPGFDRVAFRKQFNAGVLGFFRAQFGDR